MILAVDVFYKQSSAKIVGLIFNEWTNARYAQKIEKFRNDIANYEPGAFYKRELPCIMDILADLDLTQLDYIIVDGYVFLDDEGKPGLGAYLYEALPIKVPVIGVAKTSFANNKKYVAEVFRGISQKPLFITAMGEDLTKAAAMVRSMSGDYRFPTMLKALDDFTKSDTVVNE
ncbi:endonuclease V [Emticicia fontis]